MMEREAVCQLLDDMGISYHLVEHQAVYSMAQMEKVQIDTYGPVCKNLFLKDAKGQAHFLVALSQHKSADLKRLAAQLGCKSLSFASEERLRKYLNLGKGEVTVLGILNDEERAVTVVLDQTLQGQERLGFHPNDNRVTIWLSFDELCQVIEQHGNRIVLVDI